MNKTELIDGLEARLGDRKVAVAALDGFLDIINRAVAKGEKVSISGFGTFEKVDRPARKARNPRTGESVRVKKTAVPKFRPGTGLKSVAAGTTKLGREPKHEPLLPSGITRIIDTALKDDVAAAKSASGARATRSASKATAKTATAKATTAKATPAQNTAKKAAPAKKAPAASGAKASPARKTTAKKTTPATTAATTTAAKSSTKSTAAKKAPAKRATARKATAKASS